MFGWFAGLFRRENRGLFRYHDGRCWRYGDPWRLHRALFHHPKVDAITGQISAYNGDEPATSEFLAMVAEVFDMQRWDGRRGLTDAKILATFEDFCDYVISVKKNISLGPMLPQPTDRSLPSGTDQAEPGNGSAELLSTANGSTAGASAGT